MFKKGNNEGNTNYIQINQEMKNKTIEKSEKGPSNFTKILGILKNQKLFLKIKING